MVNSAYQKYQNNSVLTARPEELTLMLYNGAIKFCNQAIESINKKDVQKSHTDIMKAQNIIEELQVTLNGDYEIAHEMNRMYEFVKQLLMEANIYKDINKLEDALYFLREFKEVWQEVVKCTKEIRNK
ncbi:MAG: flagellar export chaperone FliS [Cellulosilyticaceae bacterium]